MLISFLFIALCSFWLFRLPTVGLHKYDALIGWGIKLLFSASFVFVYANYYGTGALSADTGTFLRESVILKNVFYNSPADYFKFLFGLEDLGMIQRYLMETDHWTSGDLTLVNDAQNVMRVNSLIAFISNGNVWPHIVVFTLLTVLGTRELYLAFYKRILLSSRSFWYLLLLFPSVGFWSGSILKEPLMMVGLFLIARALMDTELSRFHRLWRLIVGVLLGLMFKPYVLIILVLVAGIVVCCKLLFRQRLLVAVCLFFVFIGSLIPLFPSLERPFTKYIYRKQFDFDNVSKGGLHAVDDKQFYYFTVDQYKYITFYGDSIVVLNHPVKAKIMKLGSEYPFKDAYISNTGERWINYYSTNRCGSYIPLTSINNNYGQLIRNIPEALFNAAIRPLPTDPGGWLIVLNIAETLGLMALLVRFRWKYGYSFGHKNESTAVVLIFFALGVFLLIGWTTPVLGAIARYRIPAYLAILLFSLLQLKNETSNHYNRS